ncbi:hypothetical protein L3i23_12600 [Herbiconiux sp. L3-i23]|nr:hypothetical protein L3i23_12600 [Herbiconiux sp. L3-i23]
MGGSVRRDQRGTEPGTRRRRLVLAVAVTFLAGAALSGCAATAGPAPAVTALSADDATVQAVCDRAATLTDSGEPDAALDLIDRYRDGAPTPAPTVTRRTSTPTPSPTPVVDCEPERLAALDAAAQAGSMQEVPSPAQSFARDWDRVAVGLIVPLLPALLTAGVAFLVFAILGRLAALLPGMPWPAVRSRVRRVTVTSAGLVLAAAGAVLLAATLPLGIPSLLALWALVGLAGSVLLGAAFAGRLRIGIEVREGDRNIREASAQVIAQLQSIGAAPPRGVEAPIGSDVTALADAVLQAPATNPVVQLVRLVGSALFTTTPWRVLVAIEDDRASVIVTRNGRAVAAHEVDPSRLFPVGITDPASGESSPPAIAAARPVDEPAPPVLLPFVHECAAAVVITALATEYDGFEALGSTSWESVALQYVATTAFDADPETKRRLLAASLEADPDNLVAESALHHAMFRHADRPEEIVPYLELLERRIESLLVAPSSVPASTSPVVVTPDPEVGHIEGEMPAPGSLDLVRRLLIGYLAASLNLQEFGIGDARRERNARRLVDLLANGTPASGGLRDRMRLSAGLMYVEVVPGEKGTSSPVDLWSQRALRSSSPRVAFNGACYFSTQWRDSLPPSQKVVIEAHVAERLRYALVVPELRAAARVDPVLAHHRGHPWFEDLLDSYE